MVSLTSLLGNVSAIIQSHPICQRLTVIETREYAHDQFVFKMRALVSDGMNFQARVYFNRGHIDYAYQLFGSVPLLRWDNKEEFHSISTYPHHHHNEFGRIQSSPLSGDPLVDIPIVLDEVAKFLASSAQNVQ